MPSSQVSGFRASRFRVSVGYGVGLIVLVLARPHLGWLPAASALIVAGELIRLWASGHIEKTETLATGGPYAHTRNPLYFGSLLMALGAGVAVTSPWSLLVIALYFLALFPGVIREEASFLREKFADDYAEWERHVPTFFPRLTPGGPRRSTFAWSRVKRNREWQTAAAIPALLGTFALWAWLRA